MNIIFLSATLVLFVCAVNASSNIGKLVATTSTCMYVRSYLLVLAIASYSYMYIL